jgi:hypothetical protein
MSGRTRIVATLCAVWLLASLGLAAARWPSYWEYIASEQTPMTWLQSVVLVVAACASGLVASLVPPASPGTKSGGGRPWWVLCAGFAALSIDERFALHERVRDGYLAPRDVSIPLLPWVAPGDFLMLLVGLAGLALLPFVWRAVRDDMWCRTALLVGVVLAAAAVGLDSVDPSTWSLEGERMQQSGEEVLELASGLALLGAVLLRLLTVLQPLRSAAGTATGAAAEPAAGTAVVSGALSHQGSGDSSDALTPTGQA